jgi:hypothetical protein
MRNDHPRRNSMWPTNRLQKVHDELAWSRHHNRAGTETAFGNVVWNPSTQGRVLIVRSW